MDAGVARRRAGAGRRRTACLPPEPAAGGRREPTLHDRGQSSSAGLRDRAGRRVVRAARRGDDGRADADGARTQQPRLPDGGRARHQPSAGRPGPHAGPDAHVLPRRATAAGQFARRSARRRWQQRAVARRGRRAHAAEPSTGRHAVRHRGRGDGGIGGSASGARAGGVVRLLHRARHPPARRTGVHRRRHRWWRARRHRECQHRPSVVSR